MRRIVRERVNRAAALLDQRMPGWTSKINIEMLDMASTYYCVLGQLYGTFDQGSGFLFRGDFDKAATHGFISGYGYGLPGGHARNDELDDAWKQIINNRLSDQAK